ncbi:MAG: RNA methyltransferase [Bacteroidota bacterium]
MEQAFTPEITTQLYNFLSSFITDERKSRIEEVAANRTRHLCVVLEDIFQSHNASAVLRSCDCFGIQDVHIIENRNPYEVNPEVALGSSKWLDLMRYNTEPDNTPSCIEHLKKQGYRIVATTPHKDDYTIEQLPIDTKIALLFGTEMHGLSKKAIAMADDFVKIPMFGFTESFNISVSAALCLYSLTERMRRSDVPWQLSKQDIETLKLQWARNSVKRVETVEATFFKNLK